MNFFPCALRRLTFRPTPATALRISAALAAACWLAFPAPCLAGGPKEVPVYTLDDCLSLVRKQNPDVVVAGKRVDAVRATITTAKAGIYPSLTSSGYYQYREQSLTTAGGANPDTRKEDYYGDARLSQNVFSSGAVRNRIASAKILTDAEINTYQAQIDTSSLATRLAFYQTLYAEATISIRQEAVDLLTAQLKDQTQRLAAGTVGQINVNRAQVTLANQVPTLLDARASVTTSYVALAQLLGVDYPPDARSQPFHIRGELSCPPMTMTLAECLARAQAMRPEVAQRKLAIEAFKHQIVVEKSVTRPQVSAYVSYDIYSEPSLLSVHDSFSGATVGLQGSWNIFDGFATRGRVRGVQAQLAQAEAQLVGTRQQVEGEVRTAFYELKDAADVLGPLGSNITRANELENLTVQDFPAGLSTQLEELQARVDLTTARITELAVRLRYHNALARLERAMAVGRPAETHPPPPETASRRTTL